MITSSEQSQYNSESRHLHTNIFKSVDQKQIIVANWQRSVLFSGISLWRKFTAQSFFPGFCGIQPFVHNSRNQRSGMGCNCGKEVVQFGIFNIYFESLNLPSFFIGLIFAVGFVYIYQYCKRSRRHYQMSKASIMAQPPQYAPQPPPAWMKPPSSPYPISWSPEGGPI